MPQLYVRMFTLTSLSGKVASCTSCTTGDAARSLSFGTKPLYATRKAMAMQRGTPYVVKFGLHWYPVGRVTELVIDGAVPDNSASPCAWQCFDQPCPVS